MDLGLKGKRAIVTGGTRGIGRRTVDLLVAEGCDVGFCARDKKQVDEAVTALAKSGRKVIGGVVDVTDSPALRAWITKTAEALGGLDILVPNASALVGSASEADWRLGMEVDILGTVRAVEAALPFLEKSDAPSVVGIASTGAINISGGMRAYTGHKAAIIAYMSSLSTVYGKKKIRANTVSPGAIYFEGGVWDKRKREQPERYADAVKRAPFGRLASPAASYISGTNLIVDGAATTRIQY
jgi:3-oxoacyl-[acyl-carrier protein] reductase